MLRFDVFTLFPNMFVSPFAESMIRRAINAGLANVHTHNIRDYAAGKHQQTDDVPYGGGGGMVMKPEPIFNAVESVIPEAERTQVPIILMSPAGRLFDHKVATELAQHPRLAFICGHYEGVDERVRQHLCTDEISIGNFILTGGELPAMLMIDAISRLLPGMLPAGTTDNESHAMGMLEYPHYTRPADFRGWQVPDILLSGHHLNIQRWRREQAEEITHRRAAKL